ncbi:enoyl-CoA hydratase [Lysinibacillus alkalisoli]|uniref:Enoyl-CoA hydratase n=1 Tax=Lysinibacillus alkalisoli TaxID=1911548 RepID=A0A917D5Y6_9BACI|nr:enoyl-CoA hydratase [Lysinibacillus alkalisoli]GGG12050.1 enoyl-CoA hydratase [Lysinibacillus alkalisoli]
MSLVTLQTQFGVGTITLNRPEAANAMSISLLQTLSEILQMVSQRQDIYVVILTASGDKAFCAGADLKERKGMTEQEVKRAVRLIGATVNQVEQLPQPVIAAINGVAFGGGLELALACDIRVASEQAKMGLTETSLAIIPGAGGTQRLPRLIGIAKAKEYIYTARRLTAQQALQAGIVTHLFSDVYQGAQQIAKEIAKQGPLALQQAKKAMNTGSEVDLQTGLAIEALAYDALIPTRDRLEGLQAFAEKRTPHYKGE